MARELPEGTQGYAEEASELIARYEAIVPEVLHAHVLHLIPSAPCRVLDIGAGTGRDAAWLAAMGHAVTAVEPTAELRKAAMELHPSRSIEWLDDGLPELTALIARDVRYDLVMLTAVWMHLDATQRKTAMPRLASLMQTGALMLMSIRHGPVPAGRRMFDIPAEETIALARAGGLDVLQEETALSLQDVRRRPGVTWTRLAFRNR